LGSCLTALSCGHPAAYRGTNKLVRFGGGRQTARRVLGRTFAMTLCTPRSHVQLRPVTVPRSRVVVVFPSGDRSPSAASSVGSNTRRGEVALNGRMGRCPTRSKSTLAMQMQTHTMQIPSQIQRRNEVVLLCFASQQPCSRNKRAVGTHAGTPRTRLELSDDRSQPCARVIMSRVSSSATSPRSKGAQVPNPTQSHLERANLPRRTDPEADELKPPPVAGSANLPNPPRRAVRPSRRGLRA